MEELQLKHDYEKVIWRKNQCLKEQQDEIFHLKNKLADVRRALQEVKAIVCGNYEIIDPQGRKDILKLITKTEEE